MLRTLLGAYADRILDNVCEGELCEVRIRTGRPVVLRTASSRLFTNWCATQQIVDDIVSIATDYSLYAHQEEMLAGYIRYRGGIRVGVGGTYVADGGRLCGIAQVSSLNVRIPHETIGVGERFKDLTEEFENTLVLSPPFGGKTTLIRDMARILSERYDVVVVDERFEIGGQGGYTFGPHIDFVSGVPKTLAIEGILRSLAPEIVVTDELYPQKDRPFLEAVERAGVRLLAGMHGCKIKRFFAENREFSRWFRYGIELSYKPMPGSIESIVRLGRD